MTGLDPVNDVLLEVACLVTDSELNVLGEGVDVVVHATDEQLAGMPPVVVEMHRASGLTEAVRASTTTLEQAEAEVMAYLTTFVTEARKAPLAGNSVSTDRVFLEAGMPLLAGHLHYRTVDVSSIKELARRWYPRAYYASPRKTGNHRALGDIIDSVRELRYYRSTVFVEAPGPDSATAQAVAAGL